MKDEKEIEKLPKITSCVITESNLCIFYRGARGIYSKHYIASFCLFKEFSIVSRSRVYFLEVSNGGSDIIYEKTLWGKSDDEIRRCATIETIVETLGGSLVSDCLINELIGVFL